jgi:transcription-repair coupling factor (superfamily II helicase)
MNLSVLMDSYLKSPRLFQLTDRLTFAQPQKIYLKNLLASSAEFVLASVLLKEETSKLNHVIVLNDAEEAAYFHNTLENISSQLDLFYFPSSFKNRKNFSLLNSSHVMLRTEALTRISSGGNKKIVVTYPEALFEKVVIPEVIKKNIIFIKANDTLNLDSIMELFVMYGFTRTDFVYEPGQFALRGGILDIYSFGNEKPYRVELFGNEVDSIRIFDPETQLSERKLLQVSIIPNVETQFSSDEKISFIEFLPENTVFWLKDWEVIEENLNQHFEDVSLFIQNVQQHKKESSFADDEETRVWKNVILHDFETANSIQQKIITKHIVEFGFKPHFSLFEIEFNTKAQPAFNRQFELLIKDLKQHEQKGFTLFLFAEQAKQLERLHSIFQDLKTEINFIPVTSAIHEGFIDDDLKIVCYTDHQIFQRYHKYKVKQAYNKNKALTLRTLRELQPGDFVTHIDHGVGVFSGLQKIEVNGRMQEAVRLIYKDGLIFYTSTSTVCTRLQNLQVKTAPFLK